MGLSRAKEGIGIGLAIAREIARVLGADLRFADAQEAPADEAAGGVGLRVTVRLVQAPAG
jgi:signal transduction histidine kinase